MDLGTSVPSDVLHLHHAKAQSQGSKLATTTSVHTQESGIGRAGWHLSRKSWFTGLRIDVVSRQILMCRSRYRNDSTPSQSTSKNRVNTRSNGHCTEDTDVEIYSIRDSCIPTAKSAVTRRILICSPGQSANDGAFKRWIKDNRAATITLPTCSWEDMVATRNTKSKHDISLPIRRLRGRLCMTGSLARPSSTPNCWTEL
jgi:hypothetical protein